MDADFGRDEEGLLVVLASHRLYSSVDTSIVLVLSITDHNCHSTSLILQDSRVDCCFADRRIVSVDSNS